jgi:GntR family transcriptional regulator
MGHDSPYQRLLVELGELINSTPTGSKLPSEPLLARQLGVSRSTLREAMRFYEIQGSVNRKQGVGTSVIRNSKVIETGLEVLESLETIATRMNIVLDMKGLVVEEILADERIATAMRIPFGEKILKVRRSIYAENRPIAILEDNLKQNILSHQDFEKGFNGSVLDLIIDKGKPDLEESVTEINAIQADTVSAKLFNIQRGDTLIQFKANLVSMDHEIIDFSNSIYIPGVFRFKIVRKIGKIS